MRVGSLFSGIGGLEYGLEMAGMEVIWQVEKNDFCRKVLKKHWPDVPKYEDIFDVKGDELIARHGTVDLICGGFPCQPFSVAGQQRGKEDNRFLWPEMSRIISQVRPTWVLAENVPGIINMALDDVLTDLESKGYTTGTIIIPACATGATHRRDRVWIVGYSDEVRQLQQERGFRDIGGWVGNASRILGYSERCGCGGESWRRTGQEFENGYKQCEEGVIPYADGKGLQTGRRKDTSRECFASRYSEDVAYAECQRPQRSGELIEPMHTTQNRDGQTSGIVNVCIEPDRPTQSRVGGVLDGLPAWLDGHRWPAGLGQAQYDWEPPRVATGVKRRNARLQALGNAVVPQIPYIIGKYIMEVERCKRQYT